MNSAAEAVVAVVAVAGVVEAAAVEAAVQVKLRRPLGPHWVASASAGLQRV